MSRKIILIKQEVLLLVYELNRSGLLAENEKIGRAVQQECRDRKSGSAGMPRPSSYAVFCLKKKTAHPCPCGAPLPPTRRGWAVDGGGCRRGVEGRRAELGDRSGYPSSRLCMP